MGWQGSLTLAYRVENAGTRVHDRHDGPLRVLRSLHPEEGVCHSVLVHPPGGIVGGDRLDIDIALAAGAHALVTTPGATRFYRSAGEPAVQSTRIRAEPGARIEWLPLESIAFSGCLAENSVRFDLEPGAEMLGWDITALGLPASSQPFAAGRFGQRIESASGWLERGTVRADDTLLLDSPLGWAGQRTLGLLWFAAGEPIEAARCQSLLDIARDVARGDVLERLTGATAPRPDVVVVRVLSPRVEPAMDLFVRVRAAWRSAAWSMADCRPRVWRT